MSCLEPLLTHQNVSGHTPKHFHDGTVHYLFDGKNTVIQPGIVSFYFLLVFGNGIFWKIVKPLQNLVSNGGGSCGIHWNHPMLDLTWLTDPRLLSSASSEALILPACSSQCKQPSLISARVVNELILGLPGSGSKGLVDHLSSLISYTSSRVLQVRLYSPTLPILWEFRPVHALIHL